MIDYAWLAGFFDGEGTCFVNVRSGPGGEGKPKWRVRPIVTLRQSNRQVLERIRNELKMGGVYEGISGLGERKKTYSFEIQKRADIKSFIEKIGAKVVLRKDQLILMKELVELKIDKKPWKGLQLLKAIELAKKIVAANPKVKKETLEKLDEAMKEAKEFVEEEGDSVIAPNPKKKEINLENVIDLHNRGYSVRSIAKLLGVCTATIKKRLRENKIHIRREGWLRFGWKDLLKDS